MECLLLSVLLEPFRIRTVRKLEIENSPKQFLVEKWCRSKAQLIIIMITRPEFPTYIPTTTSSSEDCFQHLIILCNLEK